MMGFRKTNKKTLSDASHIDSLIGENSHFKGELRFEGAVRIDGRFEGDIHSKEGGTLVISENAEVAGEVTVPNLVLHGTVRGNVYASKSLQIGTTGKLNGDVEYHMIMLEEGGAINGRCGRISDKKEIASKPISRAPAKKNTVKPQQNLLDGEALEVVPTR
ncbi:MAG: polymer-forming cytoskeletal protein [Mariprofundaceae bacterium]